MQSANLTRSASTTVASTTTLEDQAVIAAHPTPAETALQKDDSKTAFAYELAQVADGQQPVSQPVEAPAEQPATEADAEQWLLHMLGQQSAQLQARDAEHDNETINTPIQALPRTLVAQEFAEQVTDNQAFKASTAAPIAPAGELIASTVSAAISGQVNTQPETVSAQFEKVKLDHSESAHQPLIAQMEPLVTGTATTNSEIATHIDATLMNTSVNESTALERTLKLQGPETKWGEQLLQALRDNVELHMQQRVQNTAIRLDPPELGVMEIVLTHEQGRLNVQISAQHSDVVRLLQQTSDRLRHELVAQNFTQVDVEISGGQTGQQHSQRDQGRLFNEQSVLANQREADQSNAHHLAPEPQKSAQHNGVLVTV